MARQGEVYDPATGQVTAYADLSPEADVSAAVEAAARAGWQWRDASLPRRTAVIFAFRRS